MKFKMPWLKNPHKTGIQESYLNIVKANHNKIDNIIVNGKRLHAFPQKSGMRKSFSSLHLFNVVNGVLTIAATRESNKKDTSRKQRS